MSYVGLACVASSEAPARTVGLALGRSLWPSYTIADPIPLLAAEL